MIHAAGNRLAVDFHALELPFDTGEIPAILREAGFEVCNVDIVSLARRWKGVSEYRLSAPYKAAPEVVDCATFIKWLFAQKGILLPRQSLAIRDDPVFIPVPSGCAKPGDLVFAGDRRAQYFTDPADNVGHVGLVTGPGMIIHATWSRDVRGVTEAPLEKAFPKHRHRGVRRLSVDSLASLTTVVVPENDEYVSWPDLRSKLLNLKYGRTTRRSGHA